MEKYIITSVFLFLLHQTSLSRIPEDRTINGVKTSVAAFVDFFPTGPVNSPSQIRNVDELEQRFGKLSAKNSAGYNVQQFFLNGGQEAWLVRVAGKKQARAIIGDSASSTGLYALDRVDIINLLCLPRVRGKSDALKLLKAGGAYAEKRRALLLMDVPESMTSVPKIVNWAATLPDRRNVAMYYPGIKTPEQPAGLTVTGSIAGIIARIDTQYGIWRPPAGPDAWFTNISAFEREVSGPEGIELTAVGVNPIRTVRGGMKLVWGTRIRANDPGWKYIPERRLALYIEESVERGTRWTASEPNNDSLWSQVRRLTTDFMQSLFLKGAFVGAKPEQAYFVRCDKETMSAADLQKGIFNVQIGFAAVKTGEFKIITIHQRASTPN
ncbi:MAG: phage tail sheath C-terminal domain-containing protein [bacterium]